MQQIIAILMENKPGALMRVTGLLSQRGYNIESLTVARTFDPTLSRMTLAVEVEPAIRAQVIKQMNKLVNVLRATDVTDGPAVNRELMLVRIRTTPQSRTAVLKEAEIFKAHVVYSTSDSLCLEATGDAEKLDEFLESIRSYGEIEITRSGTVSMPLDNKKLRLSPPVPLGAASEEVLELQEAE